MKTLQWTTVSKRIADLIPQEINPRKISDKQMSDLKKSLKKYNLVEIPVVDLDEKILAGHQRILALKILGRGDEQIDVRIPNRKLTEKESKQYLIASNQLGGDWDYDLLKHFDIELLSEAGFDDMELVSFWDKDNESVDDDFDVDKEVKKIHSPITELGDLIIMGKHKLLCASATDSKAVQKLFQDDKASMYYSDPPFNIGLSYDKGVGNKSNYGGDVDDSKTPDAYKEFINQGTVRLQIGILPLHKYVDSEAAAITLLCGAMQERGIPMHKLLFELGAKDKDVQMSLAQTLELDTALFTQCLDSPDTARTVEREKSFARSLDVTLVPTFFLNGEKSVGLPDYVDLRSMIEKKLQ